jgi:hypothetical protein
LQKKTKYEKKYSFIYFPNEDYRKYFENKLKEFYQIRKCYAHEEPKTTTNVIKKSRRICFGYLSYIQRTKVAKIKPKICKPLFRKMRYGIIKEFF